MKQAFKNDLESDKWILDNNINLNDFVDYLFDKNPDGRHGDYGALFDGVWHGGVKNCPKCQAVRVTSCSACGCGTCYTCDYKWLCYSWEDIDTKVELNNLLNKSFDSTIKQTEPEYYI